MTALRHAYSEVQKLPFTFWIIIIASFINQIGNMAMAFLVPYLTIHFHASLPQASLAYASCCVGLFISGLFAGSIADRYGAPKIMAISIFFNAIFLLAFPLLNHLGVIYFLSLCWGIAFGLFRPAAPTFIASISTRGSYKITFSIYRLANNLGLSIGPAIGGYLAVHSFPAVFYFNGSANLVAMLILILGLVLQTQKISKKPLEIMQLKPSFSFLIKDRMLQLLLLGMVPLCMVFYQLSSTLPVFIHQDLKLPLSFYGWLFTLNTLLIVFLELPLNIATLSWSPRRSLTIGSSLVAIGFASYFLVTQTWHLYALTVIWTLGEMIVFPASNSHIAELAPSKYRGNYMSLYTTSSNLGLLLGPWAGALIMHHLSSTALWLGCGLWGFLSVIVFQFLKPVSHHLNEPKIY